MESEAPPLLSASALVRITPSISIAELRSKNYTMSSIAEYLGVSKSSIFTICQKIDHEAELKSTVSENEVQFISIESNAVKSAEPPAKIPSTPVKSVDAPITSDDFTNDSYHCWYPQRKSRYSNRPRDNHRRLPGYIKIQFKDIQITFNPSQPEAEDVVTRILCGINS